MSESQPITERDLALLDEIVTAAHEAHAERILACTSGNLSARLECGDRIAISGKGTRLGLLKRNEIICASVTDGTPIPEVLGEQPGLRTSTETPFHTSIYREFPDVGAVLHCQSLAATYYACRDDPMPDLNFIPEVPIYVGKVASIPFLAPNSDALSDGIANALREPDVGIVQLGNHGQVVIGDSPLNAVRNAVFFELACKLCLISETRGSLRRFAPEEIDLLEGYR